MTNETNDTGQALTIQLPQQVEEALRHCPTLPSLPSVALKILELSRQADMDFSALTTALEKDPALVAKLLKVSRSPLYSAGGVNVRNLQHALSIIGLHATIAIALGFSVSQTLKSDGNNVYGLKIWRRALLSALAARCLGIALERDNIEELFLTGLLQDLGILALAVALPDDYKNIWLQAQDHDMLVRLERETLACDHMQAGAWLMQYWGLPSYVADAAAASHEPNEIATLTADQVFVHSIALSGRLADLFRPIAFYMDDDMSITSYMDQLLGLAEDWCGLAPSELEQVLVNISSMIPEIEDLFETQLLAREQVEGIMAQAQELLMLRNLQYMSQST